MLDLFVNCNLAKIAKIAMINLRVLRAHSVNFFDFRQNGQNIVDKLHVTEQVH